MGQGGAEGSWRLWPSAVLLGPGVGNLQNPGFRLCLPAVFLACAAALRVGQGGLPAAGPWQRKCLSPLPWLSPGPRLSVGLGAGPELKLWA